MEIEKLLRETDLFRGMSESFLRRFSSNSAVTRLKRGAMLFAEGTQGTRFYILIRGGIRLFKTSADGSEISVRLVRPGEIFAEVILFENSAYPVSSVAVLPSEVLSIERVFLLDLLDERDFRNEFVATLMNKQRYLTGRIMYLTTYDVEMRFFKFLLDRYGSRKAYDVDMSKKDIAAAIGTIPETLSRLIQRLKDSGIIKWQGSKLEVDPGYLSGLFDDKPDAY